MGQLEQVDDYGCECAAVPLSRSYLWKAMERGCKVSKAVRLMSTRRRKDSPMEGAVKAEETSNEADGDVDC